MWGSPASPSRPARLFLERGRHRPGDPGDLRGIELARISSEETVYPLGEPLADVIKEVELEAELKPLLTRWRDQRTTGERFGDFATRVLLPEAALAAAVAAEAKALAAVATPPTVAPTL